MKTLIFLGLILSSQVFASQGEVKVLYACSELSRINHSKEERREITFFDDSDKSLYLSGLILRRRVGEGESDFTIKKRWALNTTPKINQEVYEVLKDSSAGKFKCEYDVNYAGEGSIKGAYSCSFKTDTAYPIAEHELFLKMVESPIKEIDLSRYDTYSVKETNWRANLGGEFKKADLSRWEKDGRCLLELSNKFDSASDIEMTLLKDARKTLSSLVRSVDPTPSQTQVSKTGWALDLSFKYKK